MLRRLGAGFKAESPCTRGPCHTRARIGHNRHRGLDVTDTCRSRLERPDPRRRGRRRAARGAAAAPAQLGIHRRRRHERPRRAGEDRPRASDDRAVGPRHADDGRPGAAARAQATAGPGGHRRPHDRAGLGRNRRRSDQTRRLRLRLEAGRSAAAQDPARPDRRAERDVARDARAAAPAPRARHLRQDDRRQRRDAPDLPGDRTGRADERVGARDGRIRHGQGARRADDSSPEPADVASRSSRSTARRFRIRCSSPSSSATRRARSRAPSRAARAASSWPIAARSSSTRSRR